MPRRVPGRAIPGATALPDPQVVFLRGANVGGRTFRPKELERALERFGLVSLGTAGTFVVHRPPEAATLQRAIAKQLPFAAEMAILPGGDLLRLIDSPAWRSLPEGEKLRRWVAVLTRPPVRTPRLPLRQPDPPDWEVHAQVFGHPFVFGVRRQLGPGTAYPTSLVERSFGVPATVRWGEVVEQLCDLLQRGPP
jgi:hypothetical protein